MSYTLTDYADGVWTAVSRTLDSGTPAASDGSQLDNTAYAVWTYSPRTVDNPPGGEVTTLKATTLLGFPV